QGPPGNGPVRFHRPSCYHGTRKGYNGALANAPRFFRKAAYKMARRNDIDPVLREWAYEPGEISARIVKATDGRQVVQMRIEMGLLQMELEGRPDGERPEGFPSLLDYLQNRAMLDGTEWVLDEDECLAVD